MSPSILASSPFLSGPLVSVAVIPFPAGAAPHCPPRHACQTTPMVSAL